MNDFSIELPVRVSTLWGVPPIAVLLMGCFLGVVGVGVLFAFLIRRHNREQGLRRRHNRAVDQLTRLTSARHRVLPYPLPPRWLAVRSSNTAYLRELLGLRTTVPWGEALTRARERTLFISNPVNGWTLLVGGAIPDPAQDIDALFRCLTRVSTDVGEVQFFAGDRVLNFHAWARLRDGRTLRAYAWSGEVQWNEGWMTLEERLLGLRCRGYGEEVGALRYGEIPAEQTNAERVPILARRWSIDFAAASEVLLAQEGVESGGEETDGESDGDDDGHFA